MFEPHLGGPVLRFARRDGMRVERADYRVEDRRRRCACAGWTTSPTLATPRTIAATTFVSVLSLPGTGAYAPAIRSGCLLVAALPPEWRFTPTTGPDGGLDLPGSAGPGRPTRYQRNRPGPYRLTYRQAPRSQTGRGVGWRDLNPRPSVPQHARAHIRVCTLEHAKRVWAGQHSPATPTRHSCARACTDV
jgi:hypothetical protein